MIFLAGEIVVCLLAALCIGLITGWSLRGVKFKQKLKKLEKLYQINLSSLKPKEPSDKQI